MRNLASQFTPGERKVLGVCFAILAFSGMLLSVSVVIRSMSRLSLSPQAALPQPTAIPYPTWPPEWTEVPDSVSSLDTVAPSGLGVTRNGIQSSFERLGFTFKRSSDRDGPPLVTGVSQDGTAFVTLTGQPDNLGRASLTVMVSSDATLSGLYMANLMELALPDWQEGNDWLLAALDQLPDETMVSTTHEGLRINLSYIVGLELLSLSVEATR